ncbi:MAG: hypothetical protein WC710_07970 [Gallionella sp.]|jgi:hypothetical protein
MKSSILIAFILAVSSSSAYAWTEISQRQENFGGSHKVYHSLKCNSGSTGTIVNQASMVKGDFYLENTQRYFKVKSLDQAAKAFCGE